MSNIDGESPESEVERLRSENQSLRDEVARRDYRKSQVRDTVYRTFGWLGWLFLGRNVKDATEDLARATQDWQLGELQVAPLAEVAQLAGAALRRFIRVGVFGLVLTLLPLAFVVTQTMALLRQNTILERQQSISETQSDIAAKQNTLIAKQNASIERQTLHTAFEQASRFRELFIETAHSGKSHVEQDALPENVRRVHTPNDSTIQLIRQLASNNRGFVVSTLVPLLSDVDGRVSGGALLCLRDIVEDCSKEQMAELMPLFERYASVSVPNHRGPRLVAVRLEDEDLRPLDATGLLKNAFISFSQFENVDCRGMEFSQLEFSHCQLFLCHFDSMKATSLSTYESTFTFTSFSRAELESATCSRSSFRRSRRERVAGRVAPTTLFAESHLLNATFFDCEFWDLDFDVAESSIDFHQCGFFFEGGSNVSDDVVPVRRGNRLLGIRASRKPKEWDEAIKSEVGLKQYFDSLPQ